MPLRDHLFVDTGRYYPRDRAEEKFTGSVFTGSPTRWTIGPTFGRDGRYGHRLSVGGLGGPPQDCRFFKTMNPSNNYAIMSFGFRRDSNQNNALGPQFIGIANWFNINTCLATLVINQDGTLSVLRGAYFVGGGTVMGTTSLPIPLGEYHHIEWHTKFTTGSTGYTKVYINGSLTLNLTGISMSASAWNVASFGPHMEGFQFSATSSAANHDYCDIIVRDGSVRILYQGDADEPSLLQGTDPWGDTRVLCLLSEAGNGAHTDWTPLTGTDHGAMVDEAQQDDDTTYNSTNTNDTIDTYIMEDLPFDVGEVLGVQVVSVARKEIAGTAFLKGLIRIDGTDFDGDHTNGLGTTYQHVLTPFVTHDGEKFTVEEINNCESGPHLVHFTAGDDDGSNNTGDPGDPPAPPPDPPSGGCTGDPTGFGMPSWLVDLLVAAGATNCYNANIIESIEAGINANGFAIQRTSGCQTRPRLHQGTLSQTFCGHPMVDFNLPFSDHNIENNGQWHWD